jgi:uncharacterized protein involved in exopolysaccharide biosynthesis
MRRLNDAMAARARALEESSSTMEAPPEPPMAPPEPPIEPPEVEPVSEFDPEPAPTPPPSRRRLSRLQQLPIMERYRSLWWQYRRPAIAFAVGLGVVTLLGAWTIRPAYKASTTISVKPDADGGWDQLLEEGRGADLQEHMRSRAVLEQVLRELGLFPVGESSKRGWFKPAATDPEDPRVLQQLLERVRDRLTVERVRRSHLLQVTMRAETPAGAARASNAVARAFIEFHRSEAIADVERRIAALDQEIAGIQSELDMLTVLRSEVLVDDTLLDELVRQLAAADTRLSQALSRYREESPTVQQARREKHALEGILRGRIIERRMELQGRLENREQPSGSFQEPAAVTLDAAIEQVTQRYRELLSQRAETHLDLTMWQQPSDSFDRFSILDAALPPPARSTVLLILGALLNAALLVGLSLLLIPWALHRWDRRAQQSGSLPSRLQQTWLQTRSSWRRPERRSSFVEEPSP